MVFLSLALAQGRLEAGVYGASGGLTPTLEVGFTLEPGEVFLKLQGERGALGLSSNLALGPLGYLAYGLQAEAGDGGGLGAWPLPKGVRGLWPWKPG